LPLSNKDDRVDKEVRNFVGTASLGQEKWFCGTKRIGLRQKKLIESTKEKNGSH
jgi:hypothetical protein